ncbi:MAG: myo-inositol 2-dehydrogenase / D-chiro-inositol 1-dehydrogenase [Myxococcales bacterium]|nr:myo-inositol 2-dehydrogenase / D-chiro-inositol 1-dehydrogenase [Myxococcales bacterium]
MKAIIAGAGIAGFLHSLAYRAHGVTIAGVFDPDPRRAHDLAELHGARAASTFEELARIDADVASICSPPRHHVAQAEELARADRAVLIEKPVAVSLDELTRLRALPRCIPVVQWRAGRGLRAVRAAIARGELGDAPVASCDLAWGRDDAYVRARDASWGCGAVLSIGIHAIDALEWAIDRPVKTVSGLTTRRAGAWAETGAVGLIAFEGGALASLRLSLDGGGDATLLTFCGNDVTATIAGGEGDPTGTSVKWSVARGPGSHARLAALATLERETRGSLGSPLLVPYVGDVIAALRAGASPGDTQRIPSIADCSSAHETALRLAASPAGVVRG